MVIHHYIISLKEKGTSIIFSTHRMEHVELFCDKIVILVKGNNVLSGRLKDIKENYKKKNIFIKGEVDIDKIKSLEGVINVIMENDKYIVKIKDNSYIDSVFKIVSKGKNIQEFFVEDASLNEIFVNVVGENYE